MPDGSTNGGTCPWDSPGAGALTRIAVEKPME